MIKTVGVCDQFLDGGQRTWRRNSAAAPCWNKFDDVEFYLGETGCPIISDSPRPECQVVGAVDKGDHTVYAGSDCRCSPRGRSPSTETTGWQYGG